jgi:catechol 2,3-dioxygenase-like lactoylglutathione lyase family enzyme
MSNATKARAVGFNHVAIEVGDIEEALALYRRLFDFKLRGKSEDPAFIDLGDQFLALQKGRRQAVAGAFGVVNAVSLDVERGLLNPGRLKIAGIIVSRGVREGFLRDAVLGA